MCGAASGALAALARDTAHIVRNASGTEMTAGCSSSSPPPVSRLVKIAPLDTTVPTANPAAAPRAVSPVHQIPSSSKGQNVDAASANAHPTSSEMSISRATSASSIGGSIASAAAARKRRVREPPASRRRRGQMSYDRVPPSDTSKPEAVDMNAANALAATIAARISPPSPGQATSGNRRTTSSVVPVT